MALVTISSYTTNPTAELSADDVLEVRSFYTRSFIASDGITPVFGNDSNGASGPYYSSTPTLVGGNLVVPALDVQPTTESNPTGNFIQQLWVNGAYSQTLMPNNNVGTGWQIPTVYGSVIAFDEIATYNRAKRLLYPPDTYFTADETIQEILRLAGDFDYAAVGVNGITSMSVAPVLPSLPIAVGDNDPRLDNLPVVDASTTAKGVTKLDVAPASASNPIAVGVNSYATTSHLGITKLSFAPTSATDPIAVATTDPRLLDIVNVKSYGAVGDGVTDDTTAIGLALTAALAGRYPLYFPVGRYLVSGSGSQIFLVNKNIEIFGDGSLVSIIVVANSVGSVPIIRLKPPTSTGYTLLTDQQGWHIHDFGIISQGGELTDTSYSGGHNIVIDLTAASDTFFTDSVFERLYLGPLGATASSTYGIYLNQTNPAQIAGLQETSFRDIKAINGMSLVNCHDNVVLDTVGFTGEQGLLFTGANGVRGIQMRNVVDTSKRSTTITKGVNIKIDACYFEIFRPGSVGTADSATLSLKAAGATDLYNVQISNSIFGTPSGPNLDGIFAQNVNGLSVRQSTFNINAGKAWLNVGTGTNATDWSGFNIGLGASTTQYINETNDPLFSVTPTGFPAACTLALKFGGAAVGITYSARVCNYTRVGKEVHVTATLVLSSKGSSTGSATISGLPFAAISTTNDYQSGVRLVVTSADASLTSNPVGFIVYNTSEITLQLNNPSTAGTALNDTHFGNTTVILIDARYRTN